MFKAWKIWGSLFLALIVAIAIIIFSWLPEFVANRFNPVIGSLPSIESKTVHDLHRQLRVVDLHADPLLWGRDLSTLNEGGHVDVPRLIEGRVALQVFGVVTKVPSPLKLEGNAGDSDDIFKLALLQRWPIATWFSLKSRAVYQAKQLVRLEKKSSGKFSVIRTQSDLTKYLELHEKNSDMTAGILDLEGAHALEGSLKNLDVLYDVGFRVIGLAHFFDNEITGSHHGLKAQGLTPLGKKAIQKMDDLGLIIDVSHASEDSIKEVLELTSRPVIASHTGVKGTCDNQRNLTDEQILKIADSGGLIGIGFWPTAICGDSPLEIAQAIQYVTNLVGVEHVSLGSDFDGSVGVPFDVSDMIQVTHELVNMGFADDEIQKVMGENAMQLFLHSLPVA